MRDLPRQLTVEQLAELFEGDNVLVERLAAVDDPLGRARELARGLTADEQKAVLAAHPAIGERSVLSARSATEQGTDDDPQVLAELAELNRRYEERFGFRFVVFVNGRARRDIVPVLRTRLERTQSEEVETGIDELVQIAIDRWSTS